MIEFTAEEKAAIGETGQWHLQGLKDNQNSLWMRNPDQTPFWEQQYTALTHRIEIWESIMEKISIK